MDKIYKFIASLGVNPSDVDYSSLENFMTSVNADYSVNKYHDVCKYNHRLFNEGNHKVYTSFTRRARSGFTNNLGGRNIPYNDKQRKLRTMIVDYYFDDYIYGSLVPHLDKNRDADKSRAKKKLEKARAMYNISRDNSSRYFVDIEESNYNYVCNLYDHDWKSDFDAIKQINKTIHQNVDNVSNGVGRK